MVAAIYPVQVAAGERVLAECTLGRCSRGVVKAVHRDSYDILCDDGHWQYRVKRELVKPDSPMWRLECSDGAVPCELSPQGLAGSRRIRVGRTANAKGLWEQLIPDEVLRNSVSREHFEVREVAAGSAASDEPLVLTLQNLSSRGTYVNGTIVTGESRLRLGDVIAAGFVESEYGTRPVVHFRVSLGAASLDAFPRCCSAGPSEAAASEVAPQRQRKAESPAIAEVAPQRQRKAESPAIAEDLAWWLECVRTQGKNIADSVPEMVGTPIPGKSAEGPLRVGRAVQSQEFWKALISDSALLGSISREHFEVQVKAVGSSLAGILVNLSNAGTLVNGHAVRETVRLSPGDIVAVPRPKEAGPGNPIVEFRFRMPITSGSKTQHLPVPAPWLAPTPGRSRSSGPGLPAEKPRIEAPSAQAPAAEVPAPAQAQAPWLAPTQSRSRSSGTGRLPVNLRASPPPAAQEAAAEAADEAAPVIKIAFGALPPPFSLECMESRGISEAALASLPSTCRVLEASCAQARLQLGRLHQPPGFWRALLPEDALRHVVSREHFEIVMEDGELLLVNKSTAGTMVNSKVILDMLRLQHGDVLSIRSSVYDDTRIVSFRLSVAGFEADDDVSNSKSPEKQGICHVPLSESTILDAGYVMSQPPTPLVNLLPREERYGEGGA